MLTSSKTRTFRQRQRGIVLMVMLIIMIIGSVAFLVSSLSSSAVNNARDRTTADALAQAKAALIGRAVSDAGLPGSLPCPDTNDDGSAEIWAGNDCPSYIGRLPWKSLDLPDLRDGSGERLWYALAPNFREQTPTPHIINSDILGTLNVSGTATANGLVAIVFAPGNALSGQSRSSTQTAACTTLAGNVVAENLCATNYIEGTNAARSQAGSLNSAYQTAASSSTFNDQVIYITQDQLMAPVEMRIAREVKRCLDDYASDASNTNHRYPWATLVSSASAYPSRTGDYQVLFGRLGEVPNTDTSSGGTPPTGALATYLNNVQTALNNYLSNPNSTTLGNLRNAGDTLKDNTSTGTAAHSAGVTADNCTGMSCTSTLQDQLNTAMGGASVDGTMPTPNNWTTAACISFFTAPNSYWADWRDLVFYQVAVGYQPGGLGTPAPLQITGSGNTNGGSGTTYRAAVLVAGKRLGTQARPSSATPPNNYLANATSEHSTDPLFVPNAHNDTTPTTSFITYKSTDPYYQFVDDLVICVDGKNNCK